MPTKKCKPEQIVTLLRQIEVEIANGKTPHKPAGMPRLRRTEKRRVASVTEKESPCLRAAWQHLITNHAYEYRTLH
jgi:hypothetical protein